MECVRWIAAALSVLVSAAPLDAQAEDPVDVAHARVVAALRREIESRLGSSSPRNVAWGAHLAARHRVGGLEQELGAAIERFAVPLRGLEHAAVCAHLADAAVQCAVRLEPSAVARLSAGSSVAAAAILAMRDAEHCADTLRTLHAANAVEGDPLLWWATGQALAEREDREFFAMAARSLVVDLQVVVRDPGSEREVVPKPPRIRAAATEVAEPAVPSGFPEAPIYRFTLQPVRGATALVVGAVSVHYVRDVAEEGARHQPESLPLPDDELELRWLKRAAGVSVRIDAQMRHDVEWSAPDTVTFSVASQQASIRNSHRAIMGALLKKGLLTPAARQAAKLEVRVLAVDQRAAPVEPLPAFE